MKKFIAAAAMFLLIFVGTAHAAPDVSAHSAVVVNAATGSVLFEKNAREKMPMASTTKIMTALLLIENTEPGDTIVTTPEMVTVEGSSMGLLPGDTVSCSALLAGLLLASGNDAANTAAIHIAGSLSAFADMMNERAAEIGMNDTHFVTPSGLDDEEHYSTAYDMALLAACAMKNERFRAVASSRNAVVEYGNPPYKRSLQNHNKMLSIYEGAVGVKTGYTKKSGRCLVSAAERGGASVIAVTLNAPNDWDDHISLLDTGFSVLQNTVFGGNSYDIPVIGGETDAVSASSNEITIYLGEDEKNDIRTEIELPRFLYAPLKEGDEIGRETYILGGRELACVPIVSGGSAAKTEYEQSFLRKLLIAMLSMLGV